MPQKKPEALSAEAMVLIRINKIGNSKGKKDAQEPFNIEIKKEKYIILILIN